MLEIGDRVVVRPSVEVTANTIRKYTGHVFSISKIKWCKTTRYYELEGCRSEKGVPYSFAEDWLQRAEP